MSDLFAFDLIGDASIGAPECAQMAEGAVLLRGLALPAASRLLAALERVSALAPFRHMVTPGGFVMSVAMTNCGAAGWVTDSTGYRYARTDPLSGKPWPDIPGSFRDLAATAARRAGYPAFVPDSCLINRYEPGSRLSLHQDRNERNLGEPIVSVSLGLPATFQFGGRKRTDKVSRCNLRHGDVVVWGGPARLFFHGIATLRGGSHPQTGRFRFNLTFRAAL
ncbi:MAG: DNA oxidative demethylase AlkB [Rhodospirillales bacterium]